ncbi:CDA_G0052180.mRNA.1.CDS.1 [Saccharomyces cerevisiae]|nr:CDA_G0052180.mRNA.1.CDS.1 [Saccharomyces cerevisiae]CAI4828244.1 CCT_1a_G0052860.mRNA.1.CDS.1 [Saccharomyces cerevisiae]CAI7469840.1 CDA_G0052180.mRNA.1.CDS.1 [Saccharomyces cerevisiae]CAI7472864.1 CCT_1a_G0052860.mRNA.1.CDS.1 [Saccharomyces cerevisiae]
MLDNMQFHSPAPEHPQLNGGINKIPASHKVGYKLNQQVQRLAVVRNNIEERLNSMESSHGQISDSSVVRAIDASIDDFLIPSPPLSPKLRQCPIISQPQLVNVKSDHRELIMLTPVWEAGLNSQKYNHNTRNFLSQYSFFRDMKTTKRIPNKENRKLKVVKSVVNSEALPKRRRYDRKIKRRSRELYGDDGNRSENYDEESTQEVPVRSVTPIRQVKRSLHTISSPLASQGVVNNVPKYIPSMSWEKLPDYSPPLHTLPNSNNKVLKVEWKGSPMDLNHDPLKQHLHPAELVLAQILRLPCDLYLDSKRRFFLEKVHRFKKGLPFRRTDAQKACRIDVNKASRLFAAFEKIGWLQDKHFEKYL